MIIQHKYSLDEFLRVVDGPCKVSRNNGHRQSWLSRGSATEHGWQGTDADRLPSEGNAADTVKRLIKSGWERGVRLMSKVQSKVDVPQPVNIRRRGRWTDAGDEVEMQRVYAGNLEHAWRRTMRTSGRGPARVRILVDSIACAGVDAERMRWRGVAALVLADALTGAGYSVQIESVMVGGGCGGRYLGSVIVKDYQSPLDLSALAATTVMPAFFRALWHTWHFVVAPSAISNPGYMPDVATAGDFADEDTSAAVFVAHQNIENADDASRWVTKAVNQLDGEAALAA